jgi:hypothetical protein
MGGHVKMKRQHPRRNITNFTFNNFKKKYESEFLNPSSFISSIVEKLLLNVII